MQPQRQALNVARHFTEMLKFLNRFNYTFLTLFCVLAFSCKDDNRQDKKIENKLNNIDSLKILELADNYKSGQITFNRLCNYCHYSPEKKVTDQYLFDNLFDRLPKPSEEYFIKFIDDSKSLKNQKDSYVLKLAEVWNTNFEHHFKDSLTMVDKRNLIIFLKVAARQKLK